MPDIRMSSVARRWERTLRDEGLGLLEQELCGRVIVRTEIITPSRAYLPEPERLRDALELWLTGDPTAFTLVGQTILAYNGNQFPPRKRVRILLRVAEGLCQGKTVNEATRGCAGPREVAYRYLRPLYAALVEHPSLIDDDHTGDDEPRGD